MKLAILLQHMSIGIDDRIADVHRNSPCKDDLYGAGIFNHEDPGAANPQPNPESSLAKAQRRKERKQFFPTLRLGVLAKKYPIPKPTSKDRRKPRKFAGIVVRRTRSKNIFRIFVFFVNKSLSLLTGMIFRRRY
jgi:hypothetical protein